MILCKVIRNTWASITYYFFQGCFLCLFLISLDTFLINKLFLQTVSQEPYWNCRHWELFHVVLIDIYKTECPINGILFCFITYVDTCPYKDRLYLSAKYRFWRSNTSLFFVNFVFPHFFAQILLYMNNRWRLVANAHVWTSVIIEANVFFNYCLLFFKRQQNFLWIYTFYISLDISIRQKKRQQLKIF